MPPVPKLRPRPPPCRANHLAGGLLLVTECLRKKGPGPSGLQDPSSIDGSTSVTCPQTGSPSTVFACSCGCQFSTKRGLSMHRRHCQPVEVNIECIAALPTKHLKWSWEDDEALHRHSDHLWKTGMLKKERYTLLLPHFPSHSQEAIKKHLQTIKWVPPSDPVPVCHPLPEVGTETIPVSGSDLPALSSASTSVSGSDPTATWMTTLLEVAAPNLREAKMGADELSEIV
ncbi:hypothetical protein E2320_009226 [Naja naja]|nr:hypothetical protein E2320_009226 [Naja naja]